METFRCSADGWWFARLAILHRADLWCRYGCSVCSPEGVYRAKFVLDSAQGTIDLAQRLTTHSADGRLIWQFWRGEQVVARWSLIAVGKESTGWWYTDEQLQLIKVCVKAGRELSFPCYVCERGASYPNLRYIAVVGSDGRVIACLVAMWKT